MKDFTDEEINKVLDSLPVAAPPRTTNAPAGSGWPRNKK
jgi:hypothetical protein